MTDDYSLFSVTGLALDILPTINTSITGKCAVDIQVIYFIDIQLFNHVQ